MYVDARAVPRCLSQTSTMRLPELILWAFAYTVDLYMCLKREKCSEHNVRDFFGGSSC